jgi:hypothetical protein
MANAAIRRRGPNEYKYCIECSPENVDHDESLALTAEEVVRQLYKLDQRRAGYMIVVRKVQIPPPIAFATCAGFELAK